MNFYTIPEFSSIFTMEDLQNFDKLLGSNLVTTARRITNSEVRQMIQGTCSQENWANSSCLTCKNRHYEAARITLDPYYSSPEEGWCEEDSDNFGSEDGCKYYEEIKEIGIFPEEALVYEVGGI